jgi:hypothetical protein
MKKLDRALLVLTAGSLLALALVASAAGTTAAHSKKIKNFQQPVAALAVDGNNVALDLTARSAKEANAVNKVLVWNVITGKTITVSDKKTAVVDGVGGAGVFQVAIAGSRVAWLVNEGGNLESTDYLLTSSTTQPKERQIASALRSGDGGCSGRDPAGCTGAWLGGLVGSGNTLAVNRWTTDAVGHMGTGGLYAISGTQTKPIASGTDTVLAVSEDAGREAVLRTDGSVAVYSKSGTVQTTVSPPTPLAAALSGKNLVVLSKGRKIELYDAQSGSLEKTLSTHGKGGPQNLDAQGNIATYSSNSSVRAVNLSSGKDRAVGSLPNRIAFARIDGAGLVYAAGGVRANYGKSTLVFKPMASIKAAVG